MGKAKYFVGVKHSDDTGAWCGRFASKDPRDLVPVMKKWVIEGYVVTLYQLESSDQNAEIWLNVNY